MKNSVYGKITKDLVAEDPYEYIVAIGTSTGGPSALNKVITALPSNLSATYVIVQHMPSGFTKSLAQRLNDISQINVKEAEHGDVLKKGMAYVAPGGKQLRIKNNARPEISITNEEVYQGHRPSVNVMLSSIANLKPLQKVIVVIMTGMGKDGLEGVKDLKQNLSARIVVESKSTCVVHGMPKVIVNERLHDYEVPLDQIAEILIKIMGE